MSGENSFNREPLTILHQFNIQKDIKYELVGRIHYNRHAQHFTCDRVIAGHLYKSDDMLSNGDFVDIGPVTGLFELDFTVQLFVYHRLSDHDVCISSLSEKQGILIIFSRLLLVTSKQSKLMVRSLRDMRLMEPNGVMKMKISPFQSSYLRCNPRFHQTRRRQNKNCSLVKVIAKGVGNLVMAMRWEHRSSASCARSGRIQSAWRMSPSSHYPRRMAPGLALPAAASPSGRIQSKCNCTKRFGVIPDENFIQALGNLRFLKRLQKVGVILPELSREMENWLSWLGIWVMYMHTERFLCQERSLAMCENVQKPSKIIS